MSITLEAIKTGTVRLRPSAYTQPANRSVIRRRLTFLTDKTWMPEAVPVYTFLIHHPSGPILFDTGMSPNCNHAGYFPFWAPAIKWTSKMEIEAHEGIGNQLKERKIETGDLKKVVISHLHHDHSGGLEQLVDAPIYMSKEHWSAFSGHLYAAIEGCAPNHWPKDFAPKLLEATGGPIGPFERSYPITDDGKIVAVDTPGHVPGHISLIVFADDATFFLLGDAAYTLNLLDQEKTDGINDDPLKAVQTVKKIKEFARQRPLVVLPSHDWASVENLKNKTAYKPTEL